MRQRNHRTLLHRHPSSSTLCTLLCLKSSQNLSLRGLQSTRKSLTRSRRLLRDLGLKQVASNPDDQAHGMTAMYLPESVKATDLLPKLANSGVIFAGGIHKEIAAKYVRFGHMGVSVVSPNHDPLKQQETRIRDTDL